MSGENQGATMKKKSVTAGLLTFVITLIVTTLIAVFYITGAAASRRERAQFFADFASSKVQAEIQRRDSINRILEITVTSGNGNITVGSFNAIAENLFDDYLDIVDISLAPDGVVSYRYPSNAGESVREDLFADEEQGIYSDYSRMSGTSVIIAPALLKDGNYGIIIRKPIFIDGETSEEGFWGFASVTLGLQEFLSAVKIRNLTDAGYEYKIVGTNSVVGGDLMIMQSSGKELPSPVESMISTVGGDVWTLSIAPGDSWLNIYEIIGSLLIASVMSALAGFAASAYVSMKQNAKELEVLSYRDALTNINNKRSYQEHMEELSQKKLPYGLIFMDLNDFKPVNDNYGHEAGDELLSITAKRLQNSIREKDKAFRIGGDEFVVVIHGTHDEKFYEGVIERMRQNVARDIVISNNVTLKVSISAGYARCPEDGTKFEDVVKVADDAMYKNKKEMKKGRPIR